MALQDIQADIQALSSVIQANGSSGGSVSATGAAVVSILATNTSTALLAADPDRIGVAIYNGGTTDLYLLLGAGTASSSNFSIAISAGGYFETPAGWAPLAMQGVWAGSPTGSAMVTVIL